MREGQESVERSTAMALLVFPSREVILGAAVVVLEVATAIVILWAAAGALLGYAARKVRRPTRGTEDVRERFGSSLLLALDFAIGSDVLRVAIVPTFEAAGTIGITVLVRVVLTFVLEREVAGSRTP